MGDLQVLENEIHIFETTIKSVNTAYNDVLDKIFCLEALFKPLDMDPILDPLFSFKAISDPDTMYHHQAIRQYNREDFKAAMNKELQDQMTNGNFTVL